MLHMHRVVLDVEEDYRVLCERVLFQPFHIQLSLERNLCSSWYTEKPSLFLKCKMGEFKVRLYNYIYVHVLCVYVCIRTCA